MWFHEKFQTHSRAIFILTLINFRFRSSRARCQSYCRVDLLTLKLTVGMFWKKNSKQFEENKYYLVASSVIFKSKADGHQEKDDCICNWQPK